MKLRSIALCGFLLCPGSAWAQPSAYTAEDLLTAAGLNPRSTVSDAARLYGNNWHKMGADGIEYMAAGSLADAWMTFRPGAFVYVDCTAAPDRLPDDVIARLCDIARAPDWKQSLVRLRQLLDRGKPTGEVMASLSADGPLSGPQSSDANPVRGDDDADDDRAFVTLARVFVGQNYKILIEVSPRITTPAGTSRAAVMVSWKPNKP